MSDENYLIALTQDYNRLMRDYNDTATDNEKSSIIFAIYCSIIKISAVFF